MPRIAQIFRYPVKGLSPEPLARTELTAGREIPGDRAYAIAHGSTVFDPVHPQYLPKDKFLMLARNEKLAALGTRYKAETQELVIERKGKVVARGRLDQPVGRKMLEQFFDAYLPGEVRGSPRIVRAEGHTFSDVAMKCLSLINISSVRELERVMGRHIDPLRFRGNLYFDTGMPWQEFDWIGKRIVIQGSGGPVVLEGVERIRRCAATNVDPETGARDLNIPKALQSAFGHADMGIYARVIEGGTVAERDSFSVE
jgi:uncharacterized protein YcbX